MSYSELVTLAYTPQSVSTQRAPDRSDSYLPKEVLCPGIFRIMSRLHTRPPGPRRGITRAVEPLSCLVGENISTFTGEIRNDHSEQTHWRAHCDWKLFPVPGRKGDWSRRRIRHGMDCPSCHHQCSSGSLD